MRGKSEDEESKDSDALCLYKRYKGALYGKNYKKLVRSQSTENVLCKRLERTTSYIDFKQSLMETKKPIKLLSKPLPASDAEKVINALKRISSHEKPGLSPSKTIELLQEPAPTKRSDEAPKSKKADEECFPKTTDDPKLNEKGGEICSDVVAADSTSSNNDEKSPNPKGAKPQQPTKLGGRTLQGIIRVSMLVGSAVSKIKTNRKKITFDSGDCIKSDDAGQPDQGCDAAIRIESRFLTVLRRKDF